MNTAAQPLESCHHTSLSSHLILRTRNTENHDLVQQRNTKHRSWKQVFQGVFQPRQTPPLVITSSNWTRWIKKKSASQPQNVGKSWSTLPQSWWKTEERNTLLQPSSINFGQRLPNCPSLLPIGSSGGNEGFCWKVHLDVWLLLRKKNIYKYSFSVFLR